MFERFYNWLPQWMLDRPAVPVSPAEAKAAADASPTTKGGDQTDSQATFGTGGGIGFGGLGAFTEAGPFGLNHCQDILDNADLALVRSSVFNAILSGSWSTECDDDAPKGAKELIDACIVKKRTCLLKHALTALDYGYAGFEVVWTMKDGKAVVDHFKPLAYAITTIRTLPNGTVVGLQNLGKNLWGADSLLWSYNAEPGKPYGRSRLRSVWQHVHRQTQVHQRLEALASKAAGAIAEIVYMPGTGRDKAGNATDNRALAEAFGTKITSTYAGCMVVENALSALDATQRKMATPDQIIKLIEAKLGSVNPVDLGNQGPAITSLLAYIAYLGVQICRGYNQPERSLQEGQNGTKAEAGAHTDTGTADAERLEVDFVDSLNATTVNDCLVENYGEKARGKVRVVAHPLKDIQETIDQAVISNLLTNAQTAPRLLSERDFDVVFDRNGIPKRAEPLPMLTAPPQPGTPQDAAQPPQQGIPQNGNGKANGNTKVVANRMTAAADKSDN